jgi:hypothetical protein
MLTLRARSTTLALTISALSLAGCTAPSPERILAARSADTPSSNDIETTTNGTTVAAPVGMQAGDFLLAALEVDADPPGVNPPTGWTLVRDVRSPLIGNEIGTLFPSFHGMVYTHTVTDNEPSAYTFTAASSSYVDVQVVDYTGVTQVDASAGIATLSGTNAPDVVAPSVTTTGPNDMLVTIFISVSGNDWSAVDRMTQESNFDGNSLQDQVLSTSGPTGTRTASDPQFDESVVITVALK